MSRPTDRLSYTPTTVGPGPARRRLWPAIATITVLGLALAFVWSNPKDGEEQREKRAEERTAAAAQAKSRTRAELTIGKAKAAVTAYWKWEEDMVVVRLTSDIDASPLYMRLDARGQSDSQEKWPGFPLPGPAEITLALDDPPTAISVKVTMKDQDWTAGDPVPARQLLLSPDGKVTDTETGDLPAVFS